MKRHDVLARAEAHAAAFLDGLPDRTVGATIGADELRRRLSGELPATPTDPVAVIDGLVRDVEGGIVGSTSGRFFGFVIGGALPVALAADWLTSAWDPERCLLRLQPGRRGGGGDLRCVAEALLGLPQAASFAFVTGCQMAHATALAAARHKLLQDRGVDVERSRPRRRATSRVLTSENRHESIIRAARLLGIGTDAIELLPVTNSAR